MSFPLLDSRRISLTATQESAPSPVSSRNWLMYARYARGEIDLCETEAARSLQGEKNKKGHSYAYFIQGMILSDNGRLQDALERFHSCIKITPREPEPLKRVADCLYKQGRYQLALETYVEAQKLIPKPEPDVLCYIASCAQQLGDLERGVECARAAAGVGGGERAVALLSRLLVKLGDRDGAIGTLEAVLANNACSAETMAAAGTLRLQTGDPRRAFQLLAASLAERPDYHPAALALAAMMLHHKDTDAALSRLRTALTAHPDCAAAHSNLGLALLAKKKYVAAITCLQRASTAAPLSARTVHNLGLALLVVKRSASAFCRLAAATALQPDNATTVMLIGIALERLNDARADAAYARALSLAPADILVKYNMAARHARAGRLREAAAEAGDVARLMGDDPTSDVAIVGALATLITMLCQHGVEVTEWRQPDTVSETQPTITPEDLGDEV